MTNKLSDKALEDFKLYLEYPINVYNPLDLVRRFVIWLNEMVDMDHKKCCEYCHEERGSYHTCPMIWTGKDAYGKTGYVDVKSYPQVPRYKIYEVDEI